MFAEWSFGGFAWKDEPGRSHKLKLVSQLKTCIRYDAQEKT